TNVTPFNQPLNTPNPQEVVVVNQNNGNIGQHVSDRFLAHALTAGNGMGKLFVEHWDIYDFKIIKIIFLSYGSFFKLCSSCYKC
ncbi:hypothetical protein, partial [Acinetobacter pittii]|uniref:hypothetical protein n=1 Tax=Acinetobacter pittii TaxID=48296 RepID=UPI00227C986B